GTVATMTNSSVITIDFGAGNGVTDGPGYDMVLYEWPNPTPPGIMLDFITITVSIDKLTWHTLFAWEGVPGNVNGTNIDSFATDGGGEVENESITSANLYPRPGGTFPNTGIAFDFGAVPGLPPLGPGESWRYVRLKHPAFSTDLGQVDSIMRLN
ncbi:MAG: hypothetical protein ACE5G8_13645, partial [Anaerolineae bacterium]